VNVTSGRQVHSVVEALGVPADLPFPREVAIRCASNLTEGNDLERTSAVLRQRSLLSVLVLGDSISCGDEASRLERSYIHRWSLAVQDVFSLPVRLFNRAAPGGRAADGVKEAKRVLGRVTFPDLVIVAFGVNDQTLRRRRFARTAMPRASVAGFERHVSEILKVIRTRTEAETLLVAPCEPNPQWKYTSGHITDYRDVLASLSEREACALADVTTVWRGVREEHPECELLANGINHPNDAGHWLYALTLAGVTPGRSPHGPLGRGV
jgi:acyl-CoA thioesterase I